MSRIHSVIMAGGRGTRFWPVSREARPKQFLAIAGEDSLLRRTGCRLFPLAGPENVWVVTGRAHVDLVADDLPEVPRHRIVGEPVGRNTAPCIALAAALVMQEDPDGILLVAPADHWIPDDESFREAARRACEFAGKHRGLVTFGIVPASPETGYGYIERGEPAGEGIFEVAGFREKPDPPTAARFLAGGRHCWNSGIFAWRADVFLEELAGHEAEMVEACRRVAGATDRESELAAVYPSLTSISVDYAVLERSSNVFVLPASFPWSDVGSWPALADLLPADARGNALDGDAVAVDSDGCLVRGTSRLTAVLGMKDVLVVDTPDALLVCPKNRAQDVRKVVESLERSGRRELL